MFESIRQIHTLQCTFHSQPGEYALSKDVDVSLWLDYRRFNEDPPLPDFINFVMVNHQLHDEFDEFKKTKIRPSYSFIPLSELLIYYCLSNHADLLNSSKAARFGNEYLELNPSQVDSLIIWVNTTRKKYKKEGENVFTATVLQNMLSKGIIQLSLLL